MNASYAPSMIDRVRDFWNARPCNIRHSALPVGTREYFDEVEARKYFVEPHIPGFAQFERWQGKRVLEIGCGIGTDTVNFARAGAHVTAVDISEASSAICRDRLAVFGLEGEVLSGNAEELDTFLPVEPYDLIYSFGVIHHTLNPARVFEQLRQYCRPETELRIMLYSKLSWKAIWTVLTYGRGAFWRWKELIQKYSEAETGCPITHTYSSNDVQLLMREYLITDIWKNHIFPYRISDYVQYRYNFVWYFKILPRPFFRWLEQRLGWHTLIVATPAESE